MTVAVSTSDPALVPHFTEAVARFLAPANGAPDLDLTVERLARMPKRDGAPLFDSGGVWSLFDDGSRLRIDCNSPLFGDDPYSVAYFDRGFTSGRVLLRADVFDSHADPLAYPLDEVIIGNLLGRGRGVEIHGCGVIDAEGRGRLFVGQSGAGKTTTARLWLASGRVDVVSDDRIIVREIDGAWRMFGTPWHGEAELSSPRSAPIHGIYLLRQARETKLRDIAPADAAAWLFGCAFPLFYDASAVAFTLDCIDRLVHDVPVRVLDFTPDASAVAEVMR